MAKSVTLVDPELEALPEPRRPWRRTTLCSLGIVGTAALSLMIALRLDVTYALMGGQPTKLGELAQFEPHPRDANRWVQATAELDVNAAGYRRPLDPDRFRLAPVVNNPKVWVELREPSGSRDEFFIAPSSFVGRLVPLAHSGFSYRDLTETLRNSGQPTPPPDAWLLSDGSSPQTFRWLLGVVALLLSIAGFCTFGLYRLARKHQPTAS
jgi:hypothetical protein